jgi:hypothetical protein
MRERVLAATASLEPGHAAGASRCLVCHCDFCYRVNSSESTPEGQVDTPFKLLSPSSTRTFHWQPKLRHYQTWMSTFWKDALTFHTHTTWRTDFTNGIITSRAISMPFHSPIFTQYMPTGSPLRVILFSNDISNTAMSMSFGHIRWPI